MPVTSWSRCAFVIWDAFPLSWASNSSAGYVVSETAWPELMILYWR